jgi:autotransporter strand-loop-strand O-heptosyltransferase
MIYDNLIKNFDNIKATLGISFINGPKVEVQSPVKAEYKVEFINSQTGQLVHTNVINNNCWTKCLYEYFIPWHIKVYQKEHNGFVLVEEHQYKAEGKRVYIALDSKALGDTLSWFPYIEEFRKKHKCKVICSTFHNKFFKDQYPEIEFIEPGEVAHNLYAMYVLGWPYKEDGTVNLYKTPSDFKTKPLQQTASDILGLEFSEVRPKLPIYGVEKKKQVSIAIHGTAQAKYWNNPTGWQEVVDWLIKQGYEVYLLSKEGDTYMGNNHPKGIKYLDSYSIENTIEVLQESEAFIGISSGLSWLSWAVNTPTVLISGFTEEYTEPESVYRVSTPEGKCRGCFNRSRLDAGDWNWCPDHKGTERQFECSKSITSESVINTLKQTLSL